ncbi:thermonuclease family protein [Caulobacter sp. RL271]|jgi:endonuclease YncB( thermonuclease family)|uniref:Thermonuclease family protein n=1 Tax=Caulobacter segnis TaxID=88688 RepID=A0ABY4ZW41_9CAUL|nr:thermonuclease family protein [Caulobacter segnis]USQ96700.1 thermonuclease family protein [Caulobacter segnis]
MRASRLVLAVLVVAGVIAAGVFAYEVARPRVHPIKQADERKYALGAQPPADPSDPRADLFGPAKAVDGDTLLVQGVEADLWTIDAPELGQTCEDADGRPWACGEAARAHLQTLIGDHRVACRPEGPPTADGRWLGLCYVAEAPCQGDTGPCESDLASLNLAMVENGWAVDQEGQYADSEDSAQARKAGLWAGRFQRP